MFARNDTAKRINENVGAEAEPPGRAFPRWSLGTRRRSQVTALTVTPAKAGVQSRCDPRDCGAWIPASAGMT
jgi:hypothetical protein